MKRLEDARGEVTVTGNRCGVALSVTVMWMTYVLGNGEKGGRKLMLAHDHMQVIFDQVNAGLHDVIMENGHGSMLGGAGALG